MIWKDQHIEIDPPKRPKKMTATRFAAVLGLNPWASPFETWCAITRTYEEPYSDTIYTAAGKAIEPKQIAYMRDAYLMDNLATPTDVYGKDYFNKTYGDFFHDVPIFGGMWDSLLTDEKGNVETVLEFKTTKRSEDWLEDIPEYYALQAALYAWMLGCDDVIMICSFLSDQDYEAPEAYEPNADNTITRVFKVSQRYPDFAEKVEKAKAWWNTYVVTGISPDFDEKRDAEILKALRTNNLSPDTDIVALIQEGEALKAELDAAAAEMAEKEKRLKTITAMVKEQALSQFRDGDKKVEIKGSKYVWAVSRSETTAIDKDAMQADGVLEKYQKTSPTFKITVNKIKEDK